MPEHSNGRNPDLREPMSLALELAHRRYDETKIQRALLGMQELCDYQACAGVEASKSLAKRIARQQIRRLETHPTEEWRSQVPARISEYRRQADAVPWKGRTGPTDRRVFEGAS